MLALPLFSSILLLSVMMVLALGIQTHTVNATVNVIKSPFQSGYGHGCSDAGITDFTDRYINQPGKGPTYHTDEFMRGYNTGYNACS